MKSGGEGPRHLRVLVLAQFCHWLAKKSLNFSGLQFPCQLNEEAGLMTLSEFVGSQSTRIVMFLPPISSVLGFGNIAVKIILWPRSQCKAWVCSALGPKVQSLCSCDWLGPVPKSSFPVNIQACACIEAGSAVHAPTPHGISFPLLGSLSCNN